MTVEFDTPFDERYPLYTRANAGEILPEVLTPLAWSLVGESIEGGLRDSYCRHLGVFPEPETPWLTAGRFAGRLHLNLSVIRTVAERLPGLDAATNDRIVFGELDVAGLPEHVPDPEDAHWRLRGLPAEMRTAASAVRWARGNAARVRVEVARTDDFLATRPSSAVLVTRLDELSGEPYRELFGAHMTVRALTAAPVTLARQALVRAGLSPVEAMDRIAAHGLESTRPSRELAAIARTVAPGSPLALALAGRMGWAALAVSPLLGAAALRGRLEAFLDEFGHRGGNEFDPTSPAWAQRPDQLLTLLRPMVLNARPDPVPVDPGRGGGLMADALVLAARSAMYRDEVSRNALVLYTHQIRRVFFALLHRWRDRMDAEDLRMLTLGELRGVANGARVPVEVIARRREEIAWARSVEPALWSLGRLSFAASPEATGARVVQGVAGSTGTARGRVRVLADPYEDVPDGCVLVSRTADTAWTPLFVTAAAVVTDVGGMLSHAMIVARDLGIPAVVDTRVATTELRDGDLVEVDGGAGTVRVLERALLR